MGEFSDLGIDDHYLSEAHQNQEEASREASDKLQSHGQM